MKPAERLRWALAGGVQHQERGIGKVGLGEGAAPLRIVELLGGREAQAACQEVAQALPLAQLRLQGLAREPSGGHQRSLADILCPTRAPVSGSPPHHGVLSVQSAYQQSFGASCVAVSGCVAHL